MRLLVCRCILSLVVGLALIIPLFSGCKSGGNIIKDSVGLAIDAPVEGQYDFCLGWLTKRSDFEIEHESWRLGTINNSPVKVTTGSFSGVGAWYTKTLGENWSITFMVSFKSLKESAVALNVNFGLYKSAAVMTLSIERMQDGKASVLLKEGGTILANSGYVPTSETDFKIILDYKGAEDSSLRLFVESEKDFKYYVQTKAVSRETLDQIETFGFEAASSGVSVEEIGVDISGGYQPGRITKLAWKAVDDLIDNFWSGSETGGNFKYTFSSNMVWEYGTALFALETMYDATGDESIKKRISSQWSYMKNKYTKESVSTPGTEPNTAVDDAGWTALTLMTAYRITGDKTALEWAGELIRRSYDYWKDGSIKNGLWYRIIGGKPILMSGNRPITNIKSVYSAALILAALEYYEAAKDTDLADSQMYQDTLDLYNWVEKHLRRDGFKTYDDMVVTLNDNMYFCEFAEKGSNTWPYGPVGGEAEVSIGGQINPSSLFGNMVMAVINLKLYTMTLEQSYLDKTLATANSLPNTAYNQNGVLYNDRDAWTNATFVRYWVKDVLTLDGVDSKNIDLIKNTTISIATNCRTEDGYYKPDWTGGSAWTGGATQPDQIMTMGTCVNMVCAGALAEKLGLISQ